MTGQSSPAINADAGKDGDSAASEFEDLADLFERAAADGTPIRQIVGDDTGNGRRAV